MSTTGTDLPVPDAALTPIESLAHRIAVEAHTGQEAAACAH